MKSLLETRDTLPAASVAVTDKVCVPEIPLIGKAAIKLNVLSDLATTEPKETVVPLKVSVTATMDPASAEPEMI